MVRGRAIAVNILWVLEKRIGIHLKLIFNSGCFRLILIKFPSYRRAQATSKPADEPVRTVRGASTNQGQEACR